MRLENEIFLPHLWWIVFYQERNKRCIVLFTISYQSKDEEALMRVINYPARGIGNTTIEKLLVAANHYKRSILRLCKTLIKLT
jgi:DNA helicase-2/ATP-dependent DNA helicase PcrA